MNKTALGLFYGACAGWAVGCIEAAAVGLGSELSFADPFADSVQIAWRFAAAGAMIGAILPLAPSRFRPTCARTRLASPFLALATLCGFSWIHQEVFAGTPMFAAEPLLATAGLGLGAFLIWKGALRLTAPLFSTLTLSALSLSIAVLTSGKADSEGAAPKSAAAAGAPNVLFLLVDTLRADHLSSYGYTLPTSPRIDELGASGMRFDAAYAQATWTRPSVASIMTSLYPASHRTNQLKIKIPDSLTTLAETMSNAGYSTAGFSANRNVSEIFGFAQGFDSFWAHSSNELNSMLRFTSWERLRDTLAKRTGIGKKKKSPVASSADVMNEHALQWLAEDRAPDAPWFLYLQYIDPHGPYSPPQDFLDEIGVPLIAKDVLQKIGGTSQEPPFPFGAQPEVEKDLLDGIVRLYDAEIQFTDRHIGRLLDNLRSQGLLNNTYVILTSDHGEEFGEHQQFGHGQSTFDELSRIPLIIAGPGIEPGVSKTPVELIDLYPTMATWASAPQPANLQGRDLAPLLAGGDEGARSGFVQNLKSSTLTCLVVGNEKLIQVKHGDQEAWMLFNLKDDPLEQNDLASAQPDRVQHLRDLLEERRVQSEEFRVDTVNSIDITGTVAQDLSDLGYFETEE